MGEGECSFEESACCIDRVCRRRLGCRRLQESDGFLFSPCLLEMASNQRGDVVAPATGSLDEPVGHVGVIPAAVAEQDE